MSRKRVKVMSLSFFRIDSSREEKQPLTEVNYFPAFGFSKPSTIKVKTTGHFRNIFISIRAFADCTVLARLGPGRDFIATFLISSSPEADVSGGQVLARSQDLCTLQNLYRII